MHIYIALLLTFAPSNNFGSMSIIKNYILEIWASNNSKNNIRKMEIGKKEDGNREEEYEKEAVV